MENNSGAENAHTSIAIVGSSTAHEKALKEGPVGLSSRQGDALMAMVAIERSLCEHVLNNATTSS